jgi:hypothetical protein
MPKAEEHVPAEPFVRWLNQRLAVLAKRSRGDVNMAVIALARECGWAHSSSDGGVRRLYRFRKQRRSTSRGGIKQDIETTTFPRDTVEEALFAAGVAFEDLYPEIAEREAVVLEPEGWCPDCREHRTPIDGLCPFCEWRIGPATGQTLAGRRMAS